MTTIEMLKELVENGGMFESGNWLIAYDPAFGVCQVTKDKAYISTIVMDRNFMNCTWKPYVKPVDWTKVPIDTKVLCKGGDGNWHGRHFAGVVKETPYAWDFGKTSWTTCSKSCWDEMKLAK